MDQIKSFDIARIGLLLKKELFYQRRAPWIIIAAMFGLFLGINLMMTYEGAGPNDLPSNQVGFFIASLFILGTVFTSSSFNELNNKSSAHHYLSIPASHLEKLISKWLVTGILFVIVLNVFYFLFWVFSNFLTESLQSMSASMFNPFESRSELQGKTPWFFCMLYLAAHTVYLAGAVHFRKYAYFKTIIAQTLISILVIGIISLVGSIIFMDVMGGDSTYSVQTDDKFKSVIENIFPAIGKLMLFVVLPLWMLVYSFFKLKETEV